MVQGELFDTEKPVVPVTILDLHRFEEFWSAYHPKRRIAKRQAIKAWNAQVRKGTDTKDILAALRRYIGKTIMDGTEPRYILHPSTFINGRWEDYTTDEETGILQSDGRDWQREKELADEHSRKILERRRRNRR